MNQVIKNLSWFGVFLLPFATPMLCADIGKCAMDETTDIINYKVVNRYPHDKMAFTQGLVFHDTKLLESTGLYGASSLRRVDYQSGRIEKLFKLNAEYFAEGITQYNNEIIQLTWKSGNVFVYYLETLQAKDKFKIEQEGWGIAAYKDTLLISHGTENISIYDALTRQRISQLKVRQGDELIQGINELEIINDYLFANIWPTSCIAKIDLDSGQVIAWLNLEKLVREHAGKNVDALNGIAYKRDTKSIFVTGKRWPFLYELHLY